MGQSSNRRTVFFTWSPEHHNINRTMEFSSVRGNMPIYITHRYEIWKKCKEKALMERVIFNSNYVEWWDRVWFSSFEKFAISLSNDECWMLNVECWTWGLWNSRAGPKLLDLLWTSPTVLYPIVSTDSNLSLIRPPFLCWNHYYLSIFWDKIKQVLNQMIDKGLTWPR